MIVVRLLAIFVAWLSFGLLSLAVVFAGPHTDLPLQPLPLLLGLGAFVAGVVLTRQLWRADRSAGRWIAIWTVLVIAFSLFWPAAASPGRERRGAVAAVVIGAAIGVVGASAAAGYVRRVADRSRTRDGTREA